MGEGKVDACVGEGRKHALKDRQMYRYDHYGSKSAWNDDNPDAWNLTTCYTCNGTGLSEPEQQATNDLVRRVSARIGKQELIVKDVTEKHIVLEVPETSKRWLSGRILVSIDGVEMIYYDVRDAGRGYIIEFERWMKMSSDFGWSAEYDIFSVRNKV